MTLFFSKIAGIFPRSRRAIANRLNKLALNPDADSIHKLIKAAQSNNRFERCFALEVIGRLGLIAISAVPAQIEAISSSDPFVREAATSSVVRLFSEGIPPNWELEDDLKKALASLIHDHVSEGAARHAVKALSFLSPSISLLPILEFASLAVDSSVSKEAKSLYLKISGRLLPPENPTLS